MATLNQSDVQQIASSLLSSLQSAAGQSASFSKAYGTTSGTTGGVNRARNSEANVDFRNLTKAADSLSARFFGVIKSSGTFVKSMDSFNKVQVDNITKARLQSKYASEVVANFYETVSDLKKANKELPEAFDKLKDGISSGNKFIEAALKGVSVKTVEDFDNVFRALRGASVELGQSRRAIASNVAELDRLKEEIAKSNPMDVETYKLQKQYDQILEKTVSEMQKHGALTSVTAEQQKKEGHLVLDMIKSDTTLKDLKADEIKGTKALNKGTINLVSDFEKADKSIKGFKDNLKESLFDKAIGKMGGNAAEAALMRNQGSSMLGALAKQLPAAIVKIGIDVSKELAIEAMDQAKTAFETGVGPMAAFALQLRMTAPELQKIMALNKSAAFFGKEGIEQTTKNLKEHSNAFLELTGSAGGAAQLMLSTQHFTKAFSDGTQTMSQGTTTWGKHLSRMNLLTGESAQSIMDSTNAMMGDSNIQLKLQGLRGKEADALMKSIRSRQLEFGAVGMSTEQANAYAKALAGLQAETIPDSAKHAGMVAVELSQAGMSGTGVMKEIQQIMLGREMSDKAVALLAKHQAGLLKTQMMGSDNQSAFVARALREQFESGQGSNVGTMVGLTKEKQRLAATGNLATKEQIAAAGGEGIGGKMGGLVKMGEEFTKTVEVATASKGNMYAYVEDFGKSVKMFADTVAGGAEAAGGLVKKVGSTGAGATMMALFGGTLAGSLLLSPGLGLGKMLATKGIGQSLGSIFGGGGGPTPVSGAGSSRLGKVLSNGKYLNTKTMLKGMGKGGLGWIGSAALGGLSDYVGRDTKTGAFADVGSDALNMAGTGAMLGSLVGPAGTAIGGAIGGIVGGAYGLYDNWGTLTGKNQTSTPTIPTGSAPKAFQSMNDVQQQTSSQLDMMVTQLQIISNTLGVNVKHSEKTSIATQNLNQAYQTVENEKIIQERTKMGKLAAILPINNPSAV
jgi:hypothetical protein